MTHTVSPKGPRKFAGGRVPHREKRDYLEWQHTARFVEEVERLEAEGRVFKRPDLEERLLLAYNSVSAMRRGTLRVSSAAIELLKREYNGDFQYILLGVRDPEVSGPVRAGRDLRLHPPYAYRYQTPSTELWRLAGLPLLPKDEPADKA